MADPKFRNPSNTRYTKALFYELTETSDKSTVVYTLKDDDHLGFPSLYKLYMQESDVLEYNFANKYLDGWEHWQMLCESTWFKPYVERWRKELELKLRSEALAAIMDEAKSGSRNAYTANKFLVDRGWIPQEDKAKVENKRGRPSKEEIRRNAQETLDQNRRLREDFERISIVN